MLQADTRSQARLWFATVGLAVAGSVTLLMAAKASQHEARVVERVWPACGPSGFTRVELHRLVRSETRAFSNKEDTVRAVTALCQTRR
ncbi:MAG: hypothetical protein ACHQAY_23455 [Hyphomicrobiales bacterium]